jgi:Dolichyl-phosphate-mannose-protein mannosyltransferase
MVTERARPLARSLPSVAALRAWLVLAPVALFLLIGSVRIDRPGLHYDEALEAGLPAAQLLAGQPITALNGAALHIGGLALPLMVQNHIGAIQVYTALPFILIGGSTMAALRAMTVVVGALTILAVYLFVAQVYGEVAALYASLWLAAFGSFVFWSRQGVFVTSLAPCFAACALAAGAYWWRTPRLWLFGLVGLCVGLAIYSKLSALWLVNGVLAWGAITAGRRLPGLLREWLGRRWRLLLAGLAGLLLGVWPLILYNLRSGGATLRVVELNADRTYLGISNADVLGNLKTRLEQAADVVRSGDHLWYLGGTFPNQVALASVLVALLVLLGCCIGEHGRGWRSTLLAPFLVLTVILQSCFTISSLWPTHFAIAVMLPAIIFGVAVGRARVWWAGDPRRSRWLLRGLVALLPALVLVSQLRTSLSYLNATVASGGRSFHSTAIYDLARFLAARPEHIVALDWGISAPVEYLNGARTPIEELYGYDQAPPPSFAEDLRKRFGDDALFVTHAENQEAFQRRAAFLRVVADAGMWAEWVNVSVDANGWPIFEVWRVRKA